MTAAKSTEMASHGLVHSRKVDEFIACYVKRRTRPMLGFKDFNCARVILSGIELMHMIKKGQVKCSGKNSLSAAQQFYSLVS